MTTVPRDEAVFIKRRVRIGSGLKYPAVNVHLVLEKVGVERVFKTDFMAGSSVEVSGLRS